MNKVTKGLLAGSIAATILSFLFYSSDINFQYEYFNGTNFLKIFLQLLAPLIAMAIYYWWRSRYKLKDFQDKED
ncbi:hypothetical protein [Nonlabens marinus]|uniref:Uncharacterized protein n=1 Tax=Nonlabens marinus S1-08 TaxID=1454201 RepID=W8VRI1_9FLAO|nr:hypothetical protein [Nonlabens marinus]BAO56269.1 hypothetical protein NMS_2260 [Nonlabens marinus S1-08]